LSPPVAPFELIKSSLKFLRFPLRQFLWKKLSVRADYFGSAAGGGAALELRAPRSGASKQLTIFFEISSNFSKNEHHLGNGEIIGCGARVAAARCDRRKGKIQVRREPP